MTGDDLLKRIKKRECQTAVEPYARDFVDAFGIRFEDLTQEPDLEKGVERAFQFVQEVCQLFKEPRPVLTIAPFAYAYLGRNSFSQVWDIVKQRAREHPEEQGYLDEVFSAATLLSPAVRPAFLTAVRDATYIGEDMFGLDDLLQTINPAITQSAADLPSEIVENRDLHQAKKILGAYLQAGLFHPDTGFIPEFPALFSSMNGFRYLLQPANNALALVVAEGKDKSKLQKEVQLRFPLLFVDRYDSRRGLREEHPGIVLVTQPISPVKVQASYPESTIVYTGFDKNAQRVLEALPDGLSFISYNPTVIASALQFIYAQRQDSQRKFRDMVERELGKARRALQRGSGDYYTFANGLEQIGRRDTLEAMVAETGLPLPKTADKAYILVITKNEAVVKLGEYVDNKRYSVGVLQEAKPQTRPPFMVFVNSPIAPSQLHTLYPYAGIVYLARDTSEQEQYTKLDPEGTTFVVNLSTLKGLRSAHEKYHWIAETLLPRIASSLTEQEIDVMNAVEKIGDGAREMRAQILFAEHLRDYWDLGVDYYRVQSAFSPMPQLIQAGDTALMLACPTGGCFRLDQPERGGCCGGGNMPDALIDFAIAYRKSVGDETFRNELTRFNNGNFVEPWYARTRRYQRVYGDHFKQGFTATTHERGDIEF